jgi:hypothetical protein
MSGDPKLWFVVLMEDGHAVRAFSWDEWIASLVSERPDNCFIVFAKDHMDAFVRANRGELLAY